MSALPLRGLFRWAVASDYTATDPTIGIKRLINREPRARFLSEQEIRAFWRGLDSARMDERTKAALRLALVTGQRIGEVAEAERSEFDFAAAVWTIPAARAKNGRTHAVPLSPLAVSIIQSAMQAAPGAQYLFPSAPRAKATKLPQEQPLGAPAAAKAMLRTLDVLGLADNPATPHDLRRTVASHMARMGIADTVIGRVLNHVSETARTITTAVYVRHSFEPEKRRALEAWAVELERIIAGQEPATNVMVLQGKRAASAGAI